MHLSRFVFDSSILASIILVGANPTFASSCGTDTVGLGLIFSPPALSTSTRNLRNKATPGHRQLGTLKAGTAPGCGAQYSTIQAAVNAASSGDTIELCEGVFNEAVTIPASFSGKITGNGMGLSTIQSPAGSDFVLSMAPGSKVELKKVTLDGNDIMNDSATFVAGIVSSGPDAIVSEVEIIKIRSTSNSAPSIGIFAASSAVPGAENKIKIEKSVLLDVNEIGVLIEGQGMSGTIKDNTVGGPTAASSNQRIGIQVSSQASVEVEGNSVSNFNSTSLSGPSTGINVVCPGLETKVKGNDIEGNNLGVALINANAAIVEDNDIFNSVVGVSIEFQTSPSCPSSPYVKDNVVKKNTITNTQDFGIRLASAMGSSVILNNLMEENVIMVTGGSGIVVEAGDGNTFLNNIIEESTMCGICVNAGAGSLFKENKIKQSGDYGIEFDGGEGNSVEKNKVSQSSDSGIAVLGGSQNEFESNEIKESDQDGIFVDGGDSNRFTENKIETSGHYGVHVTGGSNKKFEKNGGVLFID